MPEFISNDGIALNYAVRGSGTMTSVYLHWMGGHTGNWSELISQLDAPDYRHVALDFRGHGRSERAPSEFSALRLARDVLELMDLLGADRFVVVGHSFGGKVALQVAAMVPGRIHACILIGAVGPGRVALDRSVVDAVVAQAHDVEFVRDFFRSWFKVWPRLELDDALQHFADTPKWAHRAVCETAMWTDLSSTISELTAPGLIILGKHDPVYGAAYQKMEVLPALPHAKMLALDCGHGLILERPAEIAAHCLSFLRQLANSPGDITDLGPADLTPEFFATGPRP